MAYSQHQHKLSTCARTSLWSTSLNRCLGFRGTIQALPCPRNTPRWYKRIYHVCSTNVLDKRTPYLRLVPQSRYFSASLSDYFLMAPFLGTRIRSYAMVPSEKTKLARATTVLTLARLLQIATPSKLPCYIGQN